MADISKIDFGDGVTRDLRDTSAIKWGQAKKYVGKNKLNHTFTSRTDVLTFVVNGDKTINYSGSTSSSWLTIFIKEHMTLADGDYIISGSDSANGYVSIYDEASPSTALAFSLNGSEGTFTADSSKQYKVSISFKPNLSNISGKFSPMIRPASASDNTYESPIPDNTELDARLSIAEAELDTKNYLVDDFELGSINSTTGQNENASDRVRTKEYIPVEKSTTYYYQKDVNSGGFYIFLYDASMNLTRFIDGNGSGGTFTTSATECYVRFRWTASSVDTVKGYHPMLSIGSNKQTFVPYKRDYDLRLNDILSYLETTATLSTSGTTTVTFTSAKITTSSCVEVGVSEWGLVPDDVTVSTGSCTVTLPQVDSAHSVTVRLYVR